MFLQRISPLESLRSKLITFRVVALAGGDVGVRVKNFVQLNADERSVRRGDRPALRWTFLSRVLMTPGVILIRQPETIGRVILLRVHDEILVDDNIIFLQR